MSDTVNRDAMGRPVPPARRRVERMRRHQRRTLPTKVSQPRDIADMTRNPYLYAWAEEMGRRFGPWVVRMNPDYVLTNDVTLTAEPDRTRTRPFTGNLADSDPAIVAIGHATRG